MIRSILKIFPLFSYHNTYDHYQIIYQLCTNRKIINYLIFFENYCFIETKKYSYRASHVVILYNIKNVYPYQPLPNPSVFFFFGGIKTGFCQDLHLSNTTILNFFDPAILKFHQTTLSTALFPKYTEVSSQ